MERSKLENFKDVILVQICKKIIKQLQDNDYDDILAYPDIDSYLYYENILKMFSVDSESINLDFISSIIKLNYNNNFEIPLKRPNLVEYQTVVDVSETVYQTTSFRHVVNSYSITNVNQILKLEEEIGDWAPWDGNVVNREVNDTEWNDTIFNKPRKAN